MHIKMDIEAFKIAQAQKGICPTEVFNNKSQSLGIKVIEFLDDNYCYFGLHYYKMYLQDDPNTININQKIIFLDVRSSYGGSALFGD